MKYHGNAVFGELNVKLNTVACLHRLLKGGERVFRSAGFVVKQTAVRIENVKERRAVRLSPHTRCDQKEIEQKQYCDQDKYET